MRMMLKVTVPTDVENSCHEGRDAPASFER